jgi:septal ring factor EnvC (AmiA/AmiB activator)
MGDNGPGRWERFHHVAAGVRVLGLLGAHRRLVAGIVAAALVLAGVTVFARSWIATGDATDRARADLEETRGDLARTRDDVVAATEELEAVRAALAEDLATLTIRRDERDAARAGLDAANLVLTQSQAQLDASTTDLQDRTTRLGALEECLLGVAEALNQAAVGDSGGALETVRGVEGPCGTAGVSL